MKPLKLAIEVRAGIIPGEAMDEFTKSWYLTREEYDDPDVYFAKAGAANLYALTLQNPARVNWVRLEWIWT